MAAAFDSHLLSATKKEGRTFIVDIVLWNRLECVFWLCLLCLIQFEAVKLVVER